MVMIPFTDNIPAPKSLTHFCLNVTNIEVIELHVPKVIFNILQLSKN